MMVTDASKYYSKILENYDIEFERWFENSKEKLRSLSPSLSFSRRFAKVIWDDIHKSKKEFNKEIYDGMGKPNIPPAKIGDYVLNVNNINVPPAKITDINYGYPENLEAKKKLSKEFLKIYGTKLIRKIWWVVVNDNIFPYGEDGVIKMEDVKKMNVNESEKNSFQTWLKKNFVRLKKEYNDYVYDMKSVDEPPMSFNDWAKESFENMGEMSEKRNLNINEAKSLLKDIPNEPEKREPQKIIESKFTKRHYIEIANILKNAKSKEDIINQLVDYFKKDNPLFDKTKFFTYIGVKTMESE